MPGQPGARCLTSPEWLRLRDDMRAQALVLGCPSGDTEFVLSTGLFATWVAEALGRLDPAGEQPMDAARTWFSRIVGALVWSVRRASTSATVGHDPYKDSEVWNHVLTVQDAVPIFFEVSKRDAERVQQLAMGSASPSVANLDQARRALVRKVVPALNALYRTEN